MPKRNESQTPRVDARKGLAIDVRVTLAAGKVDRTVDVVASTDEINDYGYMVDPNGWDLSRYLGNPVILYGHNYQCGYGFDGYEPEDSLPIGRAENVRIEDGKLKCTIRFATAAVSDMAERCYQGFLEGMLHAVSVGFDPLEVKIVKASGDTGVDDVPVVTKAQLVEISVVPIGADPGAVRETNARNVETLRHLAAGRPSVPLTKEIVMTSNVALATALGLSAESTDVDVFNLVSGLTADRAKMLSAVGAKTVDEALGLIKAGVEASEANVKLSAKIAERDAEVATRERGDIVAKLKTDGKLSPALAAWALAATTPIEALKSFAAAAPVLALADAPVPEPESQNSANAMKHEGKAYEELKFTEKASLEQDAPEVFKSLRADWVRRGSPTR